MQPDVAREVRRSSASGQARGSSTSGHVPLPDVPLGRYTDPEFFDLEREEVFGRSWLFVGHVSEWPAPGSFRSLDLPTGGVIVARGDDGALRAFRNACRHRGAPVVRTAEGVARLLVCAFHSWSYDLEGRLVRVPGEADFGGLCTSGRSLPPVRLDEWSGLVFVNVDEDAPPLRTFIDPIARRFDSFFESSLRLVERRRREVGANWKVVLEAFLEVYHLPTVHRDTAAQFARSSDATFGLHPGGHSTMYMPYSAEVVDADASSPVRQAMFPADLPALPETGAIFDSTNVLFSLFPNLVTPLSPQGFPIVQVWPLDVSRTLFEVHWYGPDWGGGERPAGWETKFAAWNAVLDEDMANLEPIQRSLDSAAHGGIPLGRQERAIWHLHAAIDRRVGVARVPDALAVPDLLAAAVEP